MPGRHEWAKELRIVPNAPGFGGQGGVHRLVKE